MKIRFYVLKFMQIDIENRLIERVKNDGDSDALQRLVRKYQPMIDSMFRLYWLNGYDRNDWYQESYIVCFETCKKFDGSQGSKFANFFKMRFNNHIVSLIRAQKAAKRQANDEACSFEELWLKGEGFLDFLSRPAPLVNDMLDNIQVFIDDLSDLELSAFEVIIGEITEEQACEKHNCDYAQLLRASSRCKSKIRKRLKGI